MYRGEQSCHICEAETRATCPHCGKGVCNEHKLAAQLDPGAEGLAHLERIATRLGGPDVCLACAEDEAEASRGPCVAIYRCGDPVQAEMLVESLLDAGYDARALGTRSGALLGAGQLIFDQRIEVPDKQAEAAAELIAALVSSGAEATEAPNDDDDDDDDNDREPGAGDGRRWVATAGKIVVGVIAALTAAGILIRC